MRRWLIATVAAALLGGLLIPQMASATPPVRGVSYGPLPEEIMTIYTPQRLLGGGEGAHGASAQLSGVGSPAVVLVHGGGCASPNLRNRTDDGRPEPPRAGLRRFRRELPPGQRRGTGLPQRAGSAEERDRVRPRPAGEYAGNPENIVLIGGSAGGNLVDLAGEEMPEVQGVISLSGPTNLVSLVEMGQADELHASLAGSLAMALGCSGQYTLSWRRVLNCSDVATQEAWSPVDHVPAADSCTDWLLFSAARDLVPVSQQEEFLAALDSAGCQATLQVLPGQGHSFSYWEKIKPAVDAFIWSH